MIIDRLSTLFDVSISTKSEIVNGFKILSIPLSITDLGIIQLFYKVEDVSVEVPTTSWSLVSSDSGYDLVITDYEFLNSGQLIIQITVEFLYESQYGDPSFETNPYILFIEEIENRGFEYTSEFFYSEGDENFTEIDSNKIIKHFSIWNENNNNYDLNKVEIATGVVETPSMYYNIKEIVRWQYPIEFKLSDTDNIECIQTLSNLEFTNNGNEIQVGDPLQLNLPLGYFYSNVDTSLETETSFEYYDFEMEEFITLDQTSYIQHDDYLEITSPTNFPSYQLIPFKVSSTRTSFASNIVKSNYPLFTLDSDYLWEWGGGGGEES